jgi:hypothetical protein
LYGKHLGLSKDVRATGFQERNPRFNGDVQFSKRFAIL